MVETLSVRFAVNHTGIVLYFLYLHTAQSAQEDVGECLV